MSRDFDQILTTFSESLSFNNLTKCGWNTLRCHRLKGLIFGTGLTFLWRFVFDKDEPQKHGQINRRIDVFLFTFILRYRLFFSDFSIKQNPQHYSLSPCYLLLNFSLIFLRFSFQNSLEGKIHIYIKFESIFYKLMKINKYLIVHTN